MLLHVIISSITLKSNIRTRSLFSQLTIYVALALSAVLRACGGKLLSSSSGSGGVFIKSTDEGSQGDDDEEYEELSNIEERR